MTSRFMLIFAAVSGFIFVALGAFGAHVLSKSLGVVEMGWIQTGLEYQAFHTLAILGWRWRCSAASASGFTGAASFWRWVPYCSAAVFTVWRCRIYACGRLLHLSAASASLAGWVLMFIGAIRLKRKGVVHE